MKKLLYCLSMTLFLLASCCPESSNPVPGNSSSENPDPINPVSYDSYYSNSADFSIKNLNTGIEVQNGGMVIHIGDSVYSSPNNIDAAQNDVLKLTYQPPQQYAQSNFRVVIKAFGKDNVLVTKPYETEITIGQDIEAGVYVVTCDAIADSWMEGSSDNGILQVTVLESE